MSITRVVMVRHGETEFNAQARLQGQMDVPLSPVGMRQAREVAPVIAAMGPHVIVSSPLVRARVTAETIAEQVGIDVTFDDRLKEVDVGGWAGARIADMREDPEYNRLMGSGEDFRRAGGETTDEVARRIAAAIEEVATAHAGKVVLVVAHGFALRAGVVRLLGGGYAEFLRFAGLGNCAWTVMDRVDDEEAARSGMSGQWRLRTYNASLV